MHSPLCKQLYTNPPQPSSSKNGTGSSRPGTGLVFGKEQEEEEKEEKEKEEEKEGRRERRMEEGREDKRAGFRGTAEATNEIMRQTKRSWILDIRVPLSFLLFSFAAG